MLKTFEDRDGWIWYDGKLVEWKKVDDPYARTRPTRRQVASYQPFAGGEGIAIQDLSLIHI